MQANRRFVPGAALCGGLALATLAVSLPASAGVPAECRNTAVAERPSYYEEHELVSLQTPREHQQVLVRCDPRVKDPRTVQYAFCTPSGDEQAGWWLGSSGRYRVYSFVPGEIFVATPHVLLKIQNVGGTGQNMFAVNSHSNGFTGVSGYPYYVGDQHFSSAVRVAEYLGGETVIGLDSGRMLKATGTGGSGHNLFALVREGGCFQGLCGYDYFRGCQDFSGSPF